MYRSRRWRRRSGKGKTMSMDCRDWDVPKSRQSGNIHKVGQWKIICLGNSHKKNLVVHIVVDGESEHSWFTSSWHGIEWQSLPQAFGIERQTITPWVWHCRGQLHRRRAYLGVVSISSCNRSSVSQSATKRDIEACPLDGPSPLYIIYLQMIWWCCWWWFDDDDEDEQKLYGVKVSADL